jgi:arylsulfatase A-like enzyme
MASNRVYWALLILFTIFYICILCMEELTNWKRTLFIMIPGMLYRIRNPALPYRKVIWKNEEALIDNDSNLPNIILIVADDLGINDLSGGAGVATPNIDSIAAHGANFINAYSAHATCAPSRAALFTGRNPTSFGFEYTPVPIVLAKVISYLDSYPSYPAIFYQDHVKDLPSMEAMVLPKNVTTLPEDLRQHGYSNYLIGKWHLGTSSGHTPLDRGFDESLIFPIGLSAYFPQWHPEMISAPLKGSMEFLDEFFRRNLPYTIQWNHYPAFTPDEYMTDYLTHRACDLIASKKHSKKPFFLALTYSAPHSPLQAKRSDYESIELEHIEDHTARVYAAMIKALDRGVGEVLKQLKSSGKYDNTIIIFTSDNGGAHYAGLPYLNAPYRGWKGTFFEGGIRVPFYMQWPRVIPAGSISDDTVGHVDIFTTIQSAARGVYSFDERMFPWQQFFSSSTMNRYDYHSCQPLSWHIPDPMLTSPKSILNQEEFRKNRIMLDESSESLHSCPFSSHDDISAEDKYHENTLDTHCLEGVDLIPFLLHNNETIEAFCALQLAYRHNLTLLNDPAQIPFQKCFLPRLYPQQLPHNIFFWRAGHYKAIRWYHWKLQIADRPDKIWLFNLKNDPTESHNLAISLNLSVNSIVKQELLYNHTLSKLLLIESVPSPDNNDNSNNHKMLTIFQYLYLKLFAIDQLQSPSLWPAILETAIPIDGTTFNTENPDEDYIYYVN